MDHSREELPGSEVLDKGTRDQERRARSQSGWDMAEGRLSREMKVVKLEVESVREGCLLGLHRIRCLMYLYTKEISLGGLEVSLDGIHPPR